MIQIALSVILLVASGAVSVVSSHSEPDCDPVTYREVMDEIMRTDQRYRSAISWGTIDPDELAKLESLSDDEQMKVMLQRRREGKTLTPEQEKELWDKQIAIDRANTKLLMEWVQACGWPSEEMLGEGTPSMTPVLIHMQMEDAQWVLPVLRAEVLAGRMPPRPYASIYDRKQQHEGKPQLYGMMQAYSVETKSVLAPAIHDLEATNEARKAIGMDPIEEYRITDEKTAAGR
jgi:hypothetical protein